MLHDVADELPVDAADLPEPVTVPLVEVSAEEQVRRGVVEERGHRALAGTRRLLVGTPQPAPDRAAVRQHLREELVHVQNHGLDVDVVCVVDAVAFLPAGQRRRLHHGLDVRPVGREHLIRVVPRLPEVVQGPDRVTGRLALEQVARGRWPQGSFLESQGLVPRGSLVVAPLRDRHLHPDTGILPHRLLQQLVLQPGLAAARWLNKNATCWPGR